MTKSFFQTGPYLGASGRELPIKCEFDAITPDSWHAIAYYTAHLLRKAEIDFGFVLGIPDGGKPYASAMLRYVKPSSELTLITEDVWTTGGSVRDFLTDARKSSDPSFRRLTGPVLVVAVVSNEMPEDMPPWAKALYYSPMFSGWDNLIPKEL